MIRKIDPWDTRFGFFWYNDQEIFEYGQDDFNRRAEALAASGINHVITFSCTHFRWSFRRNWDQLTGVLAEIVRACHEHGIAVTEHHSSHLTFNPLDEEGEKFMDRVLSVRKSSRDSWPYIREDCEAEPLIGGVPLSSFRQIDGRTGEWARSSYQGWCMCFNNPDYRRAYFRYLETLYDTGIDGIMTDDVQYFGLDPETNRWHACACGHCRRIFRERNGYELPPPGKEWNDWHSDYDEPGYLAWLKFRLDSTRDFHRAVKEHYEGLGLRPLRPNYCSSVLNRNPSAYTLETLPDLDWVFQENCFSSIIRYSWPDWAVEAAHRFAVGRRRNIPAMSMFYPDRPDSMNFSWALAMSWGHLYLATPEGASLNEEEKALRDFEKKHDRLLHRARKTASIAFYDSRANRQLYRHAESRSLRGLRAWMQACFRDNISFDLLKPEELESATGYDVLVLNETAIMSDKEFETVRSFAENGGKVVWTGKTGILTPEGTKRPADFLHTLWGRRDVIVPVDGEDPLKWEIGEGVLITVAGDFGLGPLEPVVRADRWQASEVRVPYQPLTGEERENRGAITAFLKGFVTAAGRSDKSERSWSTLKVSEAPDGLVITLFETGDGSTLVVHLVNTCGALDTAPGSLVGHSDPAPLPTLAGFAPFNIEITFPARMRTSQVHSAYLHAPTLEKSAELTWTEDGGSLSVKVDPGLIEFYGLIEIRLKPGAF